MKIAVIGGGISGLGAALALKDHHHVQLFERAPRFGGHADTQEIDIKGKKITVDTGFIVYNTANYPNLTALFAALDVPTKWSDMSFGMSLSGGAMEYACDGLDKIFAQRRNALSLPFLRLLSDIRRFNATAAQQLDCGKLAGLSLGAWLAREGFSDWFRNRFLLPMGGAIWSTPTARVMDFPAENFVSFFRNHDLMTGLDPAQRWRTVDGGSREYVVRIIAALGPRAQAGRAVTRVDRRTGRPALTFADGAVERFDQVIIASHGPEAAALVDDQTDMERAILGQFRTSANTAVLHSDPRLMPRRRKVWSSWNFLSEGADKDAQRPAPITYWMNRLQSIPNDTPLFVSLNPGIAPDPALVHGTYNYNHPVFDDAAFRAQRDIDQIQGAGGIWYAGAWLGYGFHEDGLRAGLRVANCLGARPGWARDLGTPIETGFAMAAE